MLDTVVHAEPGTHRVLPPSTLLDDAGHAWEVAPIVSSAASLCRSLDSRAMSWMLLIQCRDESGLRCLHSEFEPRVHRCALAIVHKDEIACEVVSASFMHAWTNAADYDPVRGSVVAWLMLITRSRSLDALRRVRVLGRHEVSFDDEDSDWTEDVAADARLEPHSHLECQRRRRRLQRALMKLSPMQRQVVALTTMDGHSHDEASRCLGLPLGTVKSHAKRGLAALKRRFEAAGASSE